MSNSFSRVLIKDNHHRLLMVQDRIGEWNFPGGKIEKGETLLQCAVREVQEEVNIHVTNLFEIYEDEFIFNDDHWKGLFYFAQSANGIPTINEIDKFKDMQFIEQVYETEFHPELTNTYHDLFKRVESLSTDWN